MPIYPDTPTPARRANRSAARRLFLIAATAVTVLAIAACGSSTKASSTTTHTTTPAPVSTPTTATTTPTTTTGAKKKPHSASHHKAAAPAKKTTKTTQTQAASTTSPATTTPTRTTHPTSTPKPKPPAFVGPMKATLVGENHTPTANKLWPYTVTATDARGRPLSGHVDVEFTFNGTVVGHATPPTDPLTNGRWHDNLTFPAEAVGQPIDLQVVIHTVLGTMTLDWPVKVKK